jgi:hypothetical protein
MPIIFLTRHNATISNEQQDLMAKAILAMEMVMLNELPLVATSIAEIRCQFATSIMAQLPKQRRSRSLKELSSQSQEIQRR